MEGRLEDTRETSLYDLKQLTKTTHIARFIFRRHWGVFLINPCNILCKDISMTCMWTWILFVRQTVLEVRTWEERCNGM